MKRDVSVRFKKNPSPFSEFRALQRAHFQLDADLYDDTLVAQSAARIMAGEQILFDTVDGGVYILDGSDVWSIRISEPRNPVSRFARTPGQMIETP